MINVQLKHTFTMTQYILKCDLHIFSPSPQLENNRRSSGDDAQLTQRLYFYTLFNFQAISFHARVGGLTFDHIIWVVSSYAFVLSLNLLFTNNIKIFLRLGAM